MAKKQPVQQVTPADTTEDAPDQRPGRPPKELPAWKAVFTTLCLPVCVLMVFTALAGLTVLTGTAAQCVACYSLFMIL